MWVVLIGAALGLGGLLAVQAGTNAYLRQFLGNPLWPAVMNFVVGLVLLCGVALAGRAPLPVASSAARAPWWAWIGGLIGATYVGAAVVLAPRLGASFFFALLVTGQLTAAVAIDHFGLIGFTEQPATVTRILGLVCLLIGVVLVKR